MEVGSLPQWNGFRKRLRTSPDKRSCRQQGFQVTGNITESLIGPGM